MKPPNQKDTREFRIRKVRHWKQRFDPAAAFVCRRRIVWGAEIYERGDLIPDQLAGNKVKLRRFWDSGFIELWEENPEPEPDVKAGEESQAPRERKAKRDGAIVQAVNERAVDGGRGKRAGDHQTNSPARDAEGRTRVAPAARKVERGPSTQIQRKEKAAGNETLNKLAPLSLAAIGAGCCKQP